MAKIRKSFQIVLPDEPYKAAATGINTINAVYEGPRYGLARVEGTPTSVIDVVHNIARFSDTIEGLDAELHVEENHEFLVIDATVNPMEMAWLSGLYTHDEIENPTFTVTEAAGVIEGLNGRTSTYTYHYGGTEGAMEAMYLNGDRGLKYNWDTQTFIEPERRVHAVDRADFFAGYKRFAADIRKSVEENDYDPIDEARILKHAEWLDHLEELYPDTDHWKISFHNDKPSII
jgi:hypothetical protein